MITNEVVAVLGPKGSGKSRWVKAWILEQAKPVVVYDKADEYTCASSHPSDPIPGAVRFPDARAFLETVERTGRLPEVSVVVTSRADSNAKLATLSARPVDLVCRWAMRRERVALVIDEADSYMSPGFLSEDMGDVIKRGRHVGIDQAYATRRPAELHRDVTANADALVLFGFREQLDLEWVRKRFGEETLDSVRKLPARTALVRRAEGPAPNGGEP